MKQNKEQKLNAYSQAAIAPNPLLAAERNRVRRRWFVISPVNGIELETMAETRAESIAKYMKWMNGTVWGKQSWSYWVKHRKATCLKLKLSFELCR